MWWQLTAMSRPELRKTGVGLHHTPDHQPRLSQTCAFERNLIKHVVLQGVPPFVLQIDIRAPDSDRRSRSRPAYTFFSIRFGLRNLILAFKVGVSFVSCNQSY
jgi:hypothetical protein